MASNKGGEAIDEPPWEGFDFKTSPFWVVVGSQGGVNAIGVDITPPAYDECIMKTSDNPYMATVNPGPGDGAFNVTGLVQGHTAIRARWGHETSSPIISSGGTLNVCVKAPRDPND